MSNYTQTASLVAPSAAAQQLWATAGATIAAGQPVYVDAGTGLAQLGQATLAASAALQGVAGNSAAAGQQVQVVYSDPNFAHGLNAAGAGEDVWLSATAGAFCRYSDLVSGNFPVLVGITTSATKMVLRLTAGGVAKP